MSANAEPCPTCSGPIRETVGLVCQSCGHDYSDGPVTARDLLGIAPDWTGGMSTVDWVREQRDRS